MKSRTQLQWVSASQTSAAFAQTKQAQRTHSPPPKSCSTWYLHIFPDAQDKKIKLQCNLTTFFHTENPIWKQILQYIYGKKFWGFYPAPLTALTTEARIILLTCQSDHCLTSQHLGWLSNCSEQKPKSCSWPTRSHEVQLCPRIYLPGISHHHSSPAHGAPFTLASLLLLMKAGQTPACLCTCCFLCLELLPQLWLTTSSCKSPLNFSPVFVNKVLLERSHVHLFIYFRSCF